MTNLNKSLLAGVFAAIAAMSNAADVEELIVRQQWPWSTDVKVECVLSGVDSPVDLAIEVWNGASKIDQELVEDALSGERFAITNGGVKTFYIDPVKVCGATTASIPDFRVKVTAVPTADKYKEVLYKIVNLETPYDVQDVTRAMLLNGEMGAVETKYDALHPAFKSNLGDICIWTGVTNDVKYMTTHLVLRKIPAAEQEFLFRKGHSVSNAVSVLTEKGTTEEGMATSFSSDFYLGVFELTQAQWLMVQPFPDGSAWETNALYSATRPVDRCYYTSRTRGSTLGLKWPEGSHTDVDEETFFRRLQDRIGLVFDFPTEAMWEFAYRAGTESGLYTGMDYSFDNFALISRQRGVNRVNSQSSADRNCDLSDGPNKVGSYLPNAWGLYDMVGNVRERCLDVYDPSYVFPAQMRDPRGSPNNKLSNRVTRGGSYIVAPLNNKFCPIREGVGYGDADKYTGFRVCLYPDASL